MICQPVAPCINHFHSLGMPNMGLKPDMLTLAASVLFHQVSRFSTIVPAFLLWNFRSLVILFIHLKEEEKLHVLISLKT